MRLSELLKTIADLRYKNESKLKSTGWALYFLVSAGATYLSDPENNVKTNTLIKHIFSPAKGRATLPPELTDVLLESKKRCYWCTFKYLMDNIDWDTNKDKLYKILSEIASDENMYQKLKNWGEVEEEIQPNIAQFAKLDIIMILKSKNLSNEAQKSFIFDFLLGYFYHLVRWDSIITSKYKERFDYHDYRPDIFDMLNIHNFNLDFINEQKISKDKPIIVVSSSGCATLRYYTETEKVKRVYFPKKEFTTKSYYDPDNFEFYSEMKAGYYSYEERFYSMSSNFTYFSYIDQDYILLWDLSEENNTLYNYKIIVDHGIDVSSIKSLGFNESNDKVIIKTKNAAYAISIRDFERVEILYKLGDGDNIVDEKRQIYINDNVLYAWSLVADNPKLIDFNMFSEKDAPFFVCTNFDSATMGISEDYNYYVVQCTDKSVWVLDRNKTKKLKIIDQQPILDASSRIMSKYDPSSAGIKTVLKMLISESQKYALVFWRNNDNSHCISIVELDKFKHFEQALEFDYEITIMTEEIGTYKDEFVIPFKVKTSENITFKKEYHISLHDDKVEQKMNSYRLF